MRKMAEQSLAERQRNRIDNSAVRPHNARLVAPHESTRPPPNERGPIRLSSSGTKAYAHSTLPPAILPTTHGGRALARDQPVVVHRVSMVTMRVNALSL